MAPRLAMDVLVPTHNRVDLLERCIRSLMRATPADRLDVHVTVICNACTDGSEDRVRALQHEYAGRMSLLVESRPGKSKALNVGIAATRGALVGMIDDDEEVDARWFEVAAAAFQLSTHEEAYDDPFEYCLM